jgi:hypothetical protein
MLLLSIHMLLNVGARYFRAFAFSPTSAVGRALHRRGTRRSRFRPAPGMVADLVCRVSGYGVRRLENPRHLARLSLDVLHIRLLAWKSGSNRPRLPAQSPTAL